MARNKVMTGSTASSGKRVLPVLVLLCLMLWAQVAAFSPEHQRHHLADQGCLLCLAGPLPFVSSGPPALVVPAAAIHWIEPQGKTEPAQNIFLSTRFSRGPPA